MRRSTVELLNARISTLNKLLDTPETPWREITNEGCRANVGCYYLYTALGVYGLNQMDNESGGCKRILTAQSKTAMLMQLDALILGLKMAKETWTKDQKAAV